MCVYGREGRWVGVRPSVKSTAADADTKGAFVRKEVGGRGGWIRDTLAPSSSLHPPPFRTFKHMSDVASPRSIRQWGQTHPHTRFAPAKRRSYRQMQTWNGKKCDNIAPVSPSPPPPTKKREMESSTLSPENIWENPGYVSVPSN